MAAQTEKDRIEIRADSLSQLFHGLDPASFYQRKLSPDVTDYVVHSVEEFPDHAPLHLVIHLPVSEAKKADGAALQHAFQRHFHSKAEMEREHRHDLFQSGRQVLAISFAVLFVCLLASWLLDRAGFDTGLWQLVKESFVIVGWVIVWRPAEIFLYEWMPIRQQWKLFDRLAHMQVAVAASPAVTRGGKR